MGRAFLTGSLIVLSVLLIAFFGLGTTLFYLRSQLDAHRTVYKAQIDSLSSYAVKNIVNRELEAMHTRLDAQEHGLDEVRMGGRGDLENRLKHLEGYPTELPQLKGEFLDDWRNMEWRGTGQFEAMQRVIAPEGKRVIVVWQALHKGGSSMLIEPMRQFCAQMRLSVYTHAARLENSGTLSEVHLNIQPDLDNSEKLEDRAANSLVNRVPKGESACVGIVRNFDTPPPLEDTVYRVISMVRDPRDMITSAYFGFGWTHSYARENQRIRDKTVSQFALTEERSPWGAIEVGTAKFYKYLFAPLLEEPDPGSDVDRLVIAYDQLVLSYSDAIQTVASFLGMPKSLAELVYHATCCTHHESPIRLLQQMARATRTESTTSHVRSFLPGGYRQRMTAAANDKLKVLFDRELELIQSLWSWDAYSAFPPPALADFSGVRPHA